MSETRQSGEFEPPRVIRCAMLHDERARFLLVGAWNTVVGYLLFAAAHILFGQRIGPAWTVLLAYAFSLPHAYATQRWLVFRSRGNVRREFARFGVTNTLLLGANLASYPLALRLTGANPLIVQACLVVALTVASYLAHKFYSFASPR